MKKLQLILLLTLSINVAQAQNKNYIDQPYIEVQGYGDTLVTPNEIFIKIQISEKDTKDKISVEEQENKMVSSLQKLGIDTEKNLTVSDMVSNYKAYIIKNKDVIKTKQFVLKVSDAVTTTKVFIELENLGISNSFIERVDHSAMESIKNAMRVKAVREAKSRAVALTKPLSQQVGPALYIADNEVKHGIESRAAGFNLYKSKSFSDKAEYQHIDFEKIKVSGAVSVKFVLK